MRVILKKNFYDGQVLHKSAGRYPVELPEALRDILPKTAKIVPDNAPLKADVAVKHSDLRDADMARAREEATNHDALVTAGLAGAAEETPPEPVVEKVSIDPSAPSVWDHVGAGWYKDQHGNKKRGNE